MASITDPFKKKKGKLFEIPEFISIRALLRRSASSFGERIAYRENKESGALAVSYTELQNTVWKIRAALSALGFDRAHIATLGESGYPLLAVTLSVLSGAGALIPLDPAVSLYDTIRCLKTLDAEVVFLASDRVEEIRRYAARLPFIRCFICEGLPREAQDERFLSYERLLETGEEILRRDPGALPETVASDISEPRMLVYTSGTTGQAKGVMLSEKNLIAAVRGCMQVTGAYEKNLSLLPFHRGYELICNLLVSLAWGAEIERATDPRHLMASFREAHPQSTLLVPLQLETICASIWQLHEQQGKSDMLRQMLRTAAQLRKAGIDRRRSFFSAIHESFGGELRHILCVGAPLRTSVAEFFEGIGIPVLQGYSLTECGCIAAIADPKTAASDKEALGAPLSDLEATIAEPDENGNGEILLRGDGVMLGYYNDPKLTRTVIDGDGWLHTGDVGCIDEKGLLHITGSMTNRIRLKNGNSIYPEEIEEHLLLIPYIEEAVVYAIPALDGEEITLGAELYLREETVKELSAGDRLKLMKREIDDLNSMLPSTHQVKTVRIRRTPFPKTLRGSIHRNDAGERKNK